MITGPAATHWLRAHVRWNESTEGLSVPYRDTEGMKWRGRVHVRSQDDRTGRGPVAHSQKKAAWLWFGMRGLLPKPKIDNTICTSATVASCTQYAQTLPAHTRRGNCLEHLRLVIGVSACVPALGVRPSCDVACPWSKFLVGCQFGHQEKPAGTGSLWCSNQRRERRLSRPKYLSVA